VEPTNLTLEPTPHDPELFELRLDGTEPGGVVHLEPVEQSGRVVYRMTVARTAPERAGRFTRDAARAT
jgi:hypothetical protein